jgi:hypothetical protein
MAILQLVAALALAGASAACFAQNGGEAGEGGSIPLGESRDGSGAAEGAIKGSSIEPGIGTSSMPERDIARCKQLAGEPREQCLRDLGAGAGGSAPPKPGLPSPAKRDPVIDPLPQNPRQPP